jgi:hypothetical protein
MSINHCQKLFIALLCNLLGQILVLQYCRDGWQPSGSDPVKGCLFLCVCVCTCTCVCARVCVRERGGGRGWGVENCWVIHYRIPAVSFKVRFSLSLQCSDQQDLSLGHSQIDSVWSLQLNAPAIPKPIGKYWKLIVNCWCEWKSGCKFVLFCSGPLSPENFQKFSMEALNTTQLYAAWTYDWVCEKVQTLTKIQ